MNNITKTSVTILSFLFFIHSAEAENKSLLSLFSNKQEVNYQKIYLEAIQKIKDEYVDEVSEKQLVQAAIDGMLSSLDPYSRFLNEDSAREIVETTKGEFSGIAVEVTMDEKNRLQVISPYENGPAFKAGVKAGDLITAIDAENTYGLTLAELAKKLRGPIGSKVVLSIYREDLKESIDVKITRDIIKLIPVSATLIPDDIIYINIMIFNSKTAEEIKYQYSKLSSSSAKPLKGVILDVRWNPGGLFDQAIETSNMFLDNGKPIVSVRGRTQESHQDYYSEGSDITNGLPIVIIVNSGTASAPEIVVGALHDNQRAVLVGTKTFGKASMQSVVPMEDGSAMKMTTAKYYTPSGLSIHGYGIEPDIIVQDIEKGLKNRKINFHDEKSLKKDPQLRRAIELLKGNYLYNKNDHEGSYLSDSN